MPSLDLTPLNPGTPAAHGKLVQVSRTATPGDNVFTATAETLNEWDSAYIMLHNIHSDRVLVTIEWGGTAAAFQIKVLIPAYSQYPVIPMHRIRDGTTIDIFADTTNVINCTVEAERMFGTAE